jgi:hypothetical protein
MQRVISISLYLLRLSFYACVFIVAIFTIATLWTKLGALHQMKRYNNGVFFCHKEKLNYDIFRKMDG